MPHFINVSWNWDLNLEYDFVLEIKSNGGLGDDSTKFSYYILYMGVH